jgi:hypothetical protein
MGDGKHCPSCGKDIGLWPIFSAGLPNRVWCPSCKTRLAYRGIAGLVLLLLVLGVALAAACLYLVQQVELTGTAQRAAAFLGLMFALWVPVELVVAVYLRNNKVLDRVNAE